MQPQFKLCNPRDQCGAPVYPGRCASYITPIDARSPVRAAVQSHTSKIKSASLPADHQLKMVARHMHGWFAAG